MHRVLHPTASANTVTRFGCAVDDPQSDPLGPRVGLGITAEYSYICAAIEIGDIPNDMEYMSEV